MPARAIFKGQVFCISGRLSKPHQDYEDCIRKHGGSVAATVNASVAFLVSSEDDVKAASQKVATAQGRDIPIVKEDFVDACVAEKMLLKPGRYIVKGTKRKAAAKAAPKPPAAKRAKVATGPVATTDKVAVIAKSGLAGEAAVVVEEVSKAFGKASVTWDVELLLNDPEKGKDKFYNMQVLADTAGKKFWCVQHWGRTGMEGAVHVDGPMDSIQDSKRAFKRKYRQKTGNPWGQVDAAFVESPGKYRLLAKEGPGEAQGRWQYYLHNRVDGKEIGWYDYAEDAARKLEKYWRQHNSNEGLGVRFVQSDYFKYEVDFTDMIQTNTKTGMRRAIRRVPAREKPAPGAPAKIPEAVAARALSAEEAESEEEAPGEEEEEEEEDEKEEEGEEEVPEGAAEGEVAVAQEEEAAEAVGDDEEAPAVGSRRPPPSAVGRASPVKAEEATAEPPAGGRNPPPDAADAQKDEDETMATELPLSAAKRRR